jgi:hypothetical protein
MPDYGAKLVPADRGGPRLAAWVQAAVGRLGLGTLTAAFDSNALTCSQQGTPAPRRSLTPRLAPAFIRGMTTAAGLTYHAGALTKAIMALCWLLMHLPASTAFQCLTGISRSLVPCHSAVACNTYLLAIVSKAVPIPGAPQ